MRVLTIRNIRPEFSPKNLILRLKKVDIFLKLIGGFAALGILAIDRISWASISQWREDQAVSIWLGYVQPFLQIPIGLMNSQALPNPNGMILIGFFLSRLPGLWVISSFLGILQSLLLIWLCWSWFGKTKLFLLTSIVLLCSAVLRATSIEFWNQWIVLYPNILFFVIISKYLQRPSITKFPFLLLVVLLAPSLYLAGAANSLSFLILFAILFFTTRSHLDQRGLLPTLLISVFITGFLVWITWIPYFQAIKAMQLTTFIAGSPGQVMRQIGIAFITFFGFIGWNLTWILRLIPAAMFFNGNMLPASAAYLITIHNFILEYLAFISFIALSFGCLSSYRKNKNFNELFHPAFRTQGKLVLYAYGFIILSFTLTALLKGPFWINGERMDMTLQFLPFFLIIWFVTPLIVQLPSGFQVLVKRISVLLAVVFIAVNIALGWITVESVRQYNGNVLVLSDIPLFQKLDVVNFVAKDWISKSSSKEIPIYYDFNVIIPADRKDDFGFELDPWYDSPYTIGRAFDYEFLRKYHLHNTQEGLLTSDRTKEKAVYIIHYAFLPLNVLPGCYQDHNINRLSVAVLIPNKPDCVK